MSVAIPLKNQHSKTEADVFSNILSTTKRSPLKIESERESDWYVSVFLTFLRSKNNQQNSRYTKVPQ